MEQFIIDYVKSMDRRYIKINNESDLLIIYDLFKNNIIGDKYNSIICLYYGFYYDSIKDYDVMKKYYLMGIDYHNVYSMHFLASHYNHIKDYDMMKKYYLMAIDHNNNHSMNNLAYYYRHTQKDYDLMKKYYLMSINCNNITAMYNLAHYYQYVEKNYDLMKKYYLMAIDNIDDSGDSMHNLAHYYQHTESNYDLMKKYYFMAVKNNNTYSIKKCLRIYKKVTSETVNDAIYFYNIAWKLEKHNDTIYFHNITWKPKKKYKVVVKAIDNNYMINNNHMTDYMQSQNISILLSKYNNICINIKQIFLNYKQIMQLLWIIKITTNIVPKHIKLNMISLLCV